MPRGPCIIVMLVALAATAVAGPKQEARRHVVAAAKLFDEGQFDEALTELLAANKLDPKPDLLFAIAQAYAKLGNCSEATAYFEKFAKARKNKHAAAVVKEAIAACVPKEPVPPSEPAPAPAPPLPPAPPPPPPTPPASATPPPAPDVSPSPPAPAPQAAPPPAPALPVREPTSRPWYSDKLGDALVLTGVASATVGLILYRGSTSDLDAAESSRTLAGYQQLVDSAHGKRNDAIALWAGGSAFVIAGIVRYALHDRREEPTGLAVTAAPRGGFVTWTGRYR